MGRQRRSQEPVKDFYSILGVPKYASEQAIKEAFRKLARLYHPDVNHEDPDTTRKFTELAEAYRTLKSKEKRDEVDARIISEYCNSFLSPHRTEAEPVKRYNSEFLRILNKKPHN